MSIDAKSVKELRERSGFGMMECKKALEKCEGNMDEAMSYLRKQGAAKSASKGDRVTENGVIAFASSGSRSAMIKLCCETDFVARSDQFQDFALGLAEAMAASGCSDVEAFLAFDFAKLGGKVSDVLKDKIAILKENIIVKDVRAVNADSGEEAIAFYVHSTDAGYKPNIGKVAAIVKLRSASAGSDKLMESGRKLAMHVAATNPSAINVDGVDQKEIEEERDIFMTQAKNSGKPDAIIEKMVEGRLRKFYEEIVLLEQPFVAGDGKQKVSEWLGADISVVDFARLSA